MFTNNIEAWPRWGVMWATAFGIYVGCKTLTWFTADLAGVRGWKRAAYLVGWPGLDPAVFFRSVGPAVARCRRREPVAALARLTIGLVLLLGVARLIPIEHVYLRGWMGMIALVLILHFGTFDLLSCVWRRVDLQARPLMNRPWSSTSVSEFWGRRWNTAFRDLTHRFLFQPLTARFGPQVGVLAGFAFSGAVHDLVISVPAGGGYGGPTLYFAIQGAALLVERSRPGRRAGLGRGLVGRLFTFVVLIGPVGLLFHRRFVIAVILPFMHAIGAL
jgi:alginate O-acetyltransferase complex protein AlgI